MSLSGSPSVLNRLQKDAHGNSLNSSYSIAKGGAQGKNLLSNLSRSAWQSLKLFLQEAAPERNFIPGAIIDIQTILKHLGLWLVKSRPIPKAHAPPAGTYILDHFSQLPMNDDQLYRDPDYPWDA